jgi:hypothetical protein
VEVPVAADTTGLLIISGGNEADNAAFDGAIPLSRVAFCFKTGKTQDTPVIIVQKKRNSNLWFTCIYGQIYVAAATQSPETKHQDTDKQGKKIQNSTHSGPQY